MRKYWTGLTALIVLLPGYAWAGNGNATVANLLTAWWELMEPAPKYQPWLWIPIILSIIGLCLKPQMRNFIGGHIAPMVVIYLLVAVNLIAFAAIVFVAYVMLNFVPFLRMALLLILEQLPKPIKPLWDWTAGIIGAAGIMLILSSKAIMTFKVTINPNSGATLPVGWILFAATSGVAVYMFFKFLIAKDKLAFLKGGKKGDKDKAEEDRQEYLEEV